MKITSCTIVYNDEIVIDMMLESVLESFDEVVIVDGGSTDGTLKVIQWFVDNDERGKKIKLIDGPSVKPEAYKQQLKDKYGRIIQNGHFGMMRQLAYDNASGDWVLWLDADECVCDDFRKKVDGILEKNKDIEMFNVPYVHFIDNLEWLDNSQAIHIGLHRFHKRLKGVRLDERYNHAMPNYKWKGTGTLFDINIFHLGYAMGLFYTYERYKRNLIFSEMHHGINQCFYRDQHYGANVHPYGYNYPKIQCRLNPNDFPLALRKRLEIGIYRASNVGEYNKDNVDIGGKK